MIREAELFVMAEQILVEVLGRIRAEHWRIVLPPLLDIPGCDTPIPLRRAVLRHVREDAQVPDLLAGAVPVEPGRFDADPLCTDPQGTVVRLADAACAAAGKVTDGAAPVHPVHGEVTTSDYLWRLAITRSFLAHDVAFHLGSTACPLTEELARGLFEGTIPEAAKWRAAGIFREPLPYPPGHVSWRDQFLRSAGRDPHPEL